jgi:tetratricopeptide (TPR) repeat protein
MNMSLLSWCKRVLLLLVATLMGGASFASESLFREARTLQRNGKHDEAITAFKSYLAQPVYEEELDGQQLFLYTEALMQLMNTFQSKGDPEGCLVALQEVYKASPTLQTQCLRDYYAVMGYALSRTEKMREAE